MAAAQRLFHAEEEAAPESQPEPAPLDEPAPVEATLEPSPKAAEATSDLPPPLELPPAAVAADPTSKPAMLGHMEAITGMIKETQAQSARATEVMLQCSQAAHRGF